MTVLQSIKDLYNITPNIESDDATLRGSYQESVASKRYSYRTVDITHTVSSALENRTVRHPVRSVGIKKHGTVDTGFY